jgi:CRP-like cAMP-binding protein
MVGHPRPALRNLLVSDIGDDAELQRRGFERVPLILGATLVQLGEVPAHAYFPLRGVISLLSSTNQGQTVEVAAVGREGVAAGLVATVSAASPVDLIVQVEGVALRLDSTRLRDHIEQSPVFRQRWLEYLQALITQITQSAVCNRYHAVPRRFARWVLTVADRAETDLIPMKHEFAAAMIGGDRPRVSYALRDLRERGLVECQRGRLRIIDRKGLTGAACECYAPQTSAQP